MYYIYINFSSIQKYSNSKSNFYFWHYWMNKLIKFVLFMSYYKNYLNKETTSKKLYLLKKTCLFCLILIQNINLKKN